MAINRCCSNKRGCRERLDVEGLGVIVRMNSAQQYAEAVKQATGLIDKNACTYDVLVSAGIASISRFL